MSGGFCPVGRPDAMLEDATYLFFVYCGGLGGGRLRAAYGRYWCYLPSKDT